jgi:hypothetical protein
MRVGLVVCVRVCVWSMTSAVSLGPRRGAGGAAVPTPEGYSEYSHGELEGYSEYSHRGRGRRGRACAVRTVTGAGIRRNPGLTVGHMLPANFTGATQRSQRTQPPWAAIRNRKMVPTLLDLALHGCNPTDEGCDGRSRRAAEKHMRTMIAAQLCFSERLPLRSRFPLTAHSHLLTADSHL